MVRFRINAPPVLAIQEGERNDAYCYENAIFISNGSLQF